MADGTASAWVEATTSEDGRNAWLTYTSHRRSLEARRRRGLCRALRSGLRRAPAYEGGFQKNSDAVRKMEKQRNTDVQNWKAQLIAMHDVLETKANEMTDAKIEKMQQEALEKFAAVEQQAELSSAEASRRLDALDLRVSGAQTQVGAMVVEVPQIPIVERGVEVPQVQVQEVVRHALSVEIVEQERHAPDLAEGSTRLQDFEAQIIARLSNMQSDFDKKLSHVNQGQNVREEARRGPKKVRFQEERGRESGASAEARLAYLEQLLNDSADKKNSNATLTEQLVELERKVVSKITEEVSTWEANFHELRDEVGELFARRNAPREADLQKLEEGDEVEEDSELEEDEDEEQAGGVLESDGAKRTTVGSQLTVAQLVERAQSEARERAQRDAEDAERLRLQEEDLRGAAAEAERLRVEGEPCCICGAGVLEEDLDAALCDYCEATAHSFCLGTERQSRYEGNRSSDNVRFETGWYCDPGGYQCSKCAPPPTPPKAKKSKDGKGESSREEVKQEGEDRESTLKAGKQSAEALKSAAVSLTPQRKVRFQEAVRQVPRTVPQRAGKDDDQLVALKALVLETVNHEGLYMRMDGLLNSFSRLGIVRITQVESLTAAECATQRLPWNLIRAIQRRAQRSGR